MTEASHTICEHYGVPYCQLHDLPMVGVHPNVEGHHLMGNQIANTLAEHLGWTVWDGEAENVKVTAGNIEQLYWRTTLKADQWQGVIFPFTLNKEIAEKLFGEGTQMAEYGNYDADSNTLHFKNVSAVEPNTPIMIRPTKTVGPILLLKGLLANASTIRKEVGFGAYRLRGLYTKTSIMASQHTAVMIDGDGKAYFPTDNFKVMPFQSYIFTNSGKLPNIVFDDATTGIQGVKVATTDKAGSRHGNIYTLQGQRVSQMTKGNIYIVNGKKTIAK